MKASWAVFSFGAVYYKVQSGFNLSVCGYQINLKHDYSNDSYRAVLSCSSLYCDKPGGFYFWLGGWNPSETI